MLNWRGIRLESVSLAGGGVLSWEGSAFLPTTAVAILAGEGVGWGSYTGPHTQSLYHTLSLYHPPVNRITHACENITFRFAE